MKLDSDPGLTGLEEVQDVLLSFKRRLTALAAKAQQQVQQSLHTKTQSRPVRVRDQVLEPLEALLRRHSELRPALV